MSADQGPRISDREFFGEHLNLDIPGMEDVRREVVKQDYGKARRYFSKYIRESLRPDLFFTIPYEVPENVYMKPGETESEAADRICENRMISCGTECDFGDQVDWYRNPTYNQYKEWTWQLSRHNEWKLLAHVYREVKAERCGESPPHVRSAERYAECFAGQFESWVRQAVCPEGAAGFETLCWRTIECGIRMGANWPYVLHTFYQSPAFTDDLLVAWYQSIWEHGKRLRDHPMHGNWLIMEMNGLAQIGILCPVLAESEEWLQFAFQMLSEELGRQIYEDGFHYELSTGYHDVVINNYQRLISVAQAYEIEVPEIFWKQLENAAAIDIKLMMPDGRVPDINDGNWKPAAELLRPKLSMFPDREDFRWAVSEGGDGKEPEYTSIALPYSGFLVMRNSWKPDGVWCLLDAAPFGRGHQHEDKLSLLLFAGGKLLVTEGGNYAYDDSEMRRYVLSTRSHNTVQVDGQDQNRRKNYEWKEEEIKLHSGLKYRIEPAFDYGEGVYDHGYGANADILVTHRRSVYFIKNPGHDLLPFFLVRDQLSAEEEHCYELLWHLNTEKLCISEQRGQTDQLTVICSGADSLILVRGQEFPEWQGWVATGSLQGAYSPVYTLKYGAIGINHSFLTILYPNPNGGCPIERIEEKEGTNVAIHLADGSVFNIEETVECGKPHRKGKNYGVRNC